MKYIMKNTAIAIALAVLTPWYAPAAQEETVNVDIDVERIIEEAKEGDGKKIVILRKEERAQKAPEPLGMNVTLTFTVAGESFSVTTATTAFMLAGQQTSTASERIGYEDLDDGESEEEWGEEDYDEEIEEEEFDDEEWEEDEDYEVEGAETHVLTESIVNISGNIQPTDKGALLIRCAGSIVRDNQADEEQEEDTTRVANSSALNFEASAIMRPGDEKTLVTHGPLRLVLHVTADES